MSEFAHQAAGRVRAALTRAHQRLRPATPDHDRRWNVVTIKAAPEEVLPGGQPPPLLAELGDAVEVDVRPAPGGRGTELHARLSRQANSPSAGELTQGDVRSVLRRTKQLFEVGEVLQSAPRPEGKRPATPAGKLVDAAVEKSDQKGVL